MAASVAPPSAALLLSAATCAAVPAAVVPSFAQSSPQDFLDLHNAARAVVGVAPLSWDGTLAAYPQSYANDCKILHSGGPYGENMFWGSAGAGWNATDAVSSWVSEMEDYDCCSNSCAAGKVCGQYTQVVWADSTRLGCANVTCGGGNGALMICEYKPAGNIVGQAPFTGCAQFDGSGKGNCSVPSGSVPSGNNSIPHGTAPSRNDSIPSGRIPRQNGNSTNGTSDSLSSRNASKRRTMLPIVLPVAIALCLISAIITCVWRRRTGSRSKNTIQCTAYSEDVEDIQAVVLLSPALVGAATDNFAEVNKLGEGGFGQVYKGMLPDGREVAVKRLSKGSKQGVRELKNELVLIAKLQHRNLVKLIGACLHEEEKLLVYEYIPNKSLDAFIFDDEKRKQLTWGTRYKIICGIARGVVYLHDESRVKVIHRDLKPSNILLEKDMTPKISDFGLARVFEGDHTKDITRRVAGTFGYMAPEYAVLGHVSTKSDVFSFGVIVLEIVTGRRNTTSEPMMAEHLLSYVWDNWTGGTITEIVDSFLHYNCAESEALKCIHIGLLCVQENPSDRPSMSNVILMLVGRSTTLPAPSRPAFLFWLNDENHFHHGVNNRPEGSNNSNSSFNMVTITELEAR